MGEESTIVLSFAMLTGIYLLGCLVAVFFIVGIVAVLWQVAKYMASRGMEEDEKYES